MPRSMTVAMASALGGTVLRPAIFVSITYLTGPVYIWSGKGTLTWNGMNFIGVGTFGSISTIEEGATVQARGITLGLSGVDASSLAGALQELSQELPVTVWLGLFDASLALIPDPIIIWSGQTDQPTITLSGELANIEINCESRLLEMNVAVDRRRTALDQALVQPGDLAFSFVSSIQSQSISWGTTPLSTNNI